MHQAFKINSTLINTYKLTRYAKMTARFDSTIFSLESSIETTYSLIITDLVTKAHDLQSEFAIEQYDGFYSIQI